MQRVRQSNTISLTAKSNDTPASGVDSEYEKCPCTFRDFIYQIRSGEIANQFALSFALFIAWFSYVETAIYQNRVICFSQSIIYVSRNIVDRKGKEALPTLNF